MAIVATTRRGDAPTRHTCINLNREKLLDGNECSRLRFVVACHHKLGRLHLLRLQLLQAADDARLALVRRLQRISCRSLRRDVRFSSHDLFPIGLAPESLSWHRLVLSRCRAPPRGVGRLEGKPALWPLP